MKIGLVIAPLLIAATAYAQAPGEMEDGDIAPPGMAPVSPEPAPPPPPMRAQRWSVGLNVGSLGLAPHMQPDNKTDFSVGQLALRYRPWRHLEVELAFGGGREKLPDGTQGDREVNQAVLDLRYRFSPGRNWNWWLMAGMGSLAVTNTYDSQDVKDAATQSTLQFGVGLERRWSRFALQAELRAVGVAPNDQNMTTKVEPTPLPPAMDPSGTTTQPPPPPPTDTTYTRDGWKGGQMTIGASYYF
jgi:hypothetical protein